MLQYEGKVTVNVKNEFGEIISQYKHHNVGLIGLISYMANCLANKIYESKKPTYMSVFYSETSPGVTGDVDNCLNLFPLYNAPIKGDAEDDTSDRYNPESTATLKSVLKGEYLAFHLNSSKASWYYQYVILDADLNIIAHCPVNGAFDVAGYGALANLNSSNSAEVVWEMTVKNKTT